MHEAIKSRLILWVVRLQEVRRHVGRSAPRLGGQPPRQQLQQHHAKAEGFAAGVVAPLRLIDGAHVAGRAEGAAVAGAAGGQCGVQQLGEAAVDELGLPPRRQHLPAPST